MFKYPKILHIGAPLVSTIFNNEVEITEKVDGSQCRIELTEDSVMVGSKNQGIADHNMFEIAHDQGERIHKETDWRTLGSKVTLFCEFLNKPNHNTIKYDRVPLNNLYLFGAMVGDTQDHMVTGGLIEMADHLEIDPPNVIICGMVESVGELNEFMTHQSYLGGSVVEGVVIKNYNRTYDPLQVHSQEYIGYPMAAKYVRDDFTVSNAKQWNTLSRKKGVDSLVDRFFIEARFRKTIQHLCEDGKIEYQKKDLQFLIPEFFDDLMDEKKDEMTRMIMGEIFKALRRRASGYVVKAWIDYLAERQFEDGDENMEE